jgi:hypothetical protein
MNLRSSRGKVAVTLLALAVLVMPVLVSFLVEALRSAPAPTNRLGWAPDIPIEYARVNDMNIRYVKVGQGPPLVLLHRA